VVNASLWLGEAAYSSDLSDSSDYARSDHLREQAKRLSPRMIDAVGLAAYLVGRSLIETSDVIRQKLKIVDVSSRNRNFIVRRDAGASYIVKQAVDRATAESIANEARVYQALGGSSAFRRGFCPAMLDFDDVEGVLVLELFPDALNLHEHYLRRGRFSRRTARRLGVALGMLHALPPAEGSPTHLPKVNAAPIPAWPWVFSLQRPDLPMMFEISQANIDLIRTIQNDVALSEGIETLIGSWTVDAMIHSDLRWENCLITAEERRELKIVDWELAGPGDACWDVGSIFGAYLGLWVQYLPIAAGASQESFVDGARYPLAAMRPAIEAFWRAYAKARGLDAVGAQRCLLRSIRFGAVRLVQGAFERMQSAGQLSGSAVCAMQLSRNMLARPEAAADLLGLAA
jgi:Phosphotransferase enzyme family